MQAFWDDGLMATSVDDLLRASGLARSALYNRFGSREQLARLALQRYAERQGAGIRELFARRGLGAVRDMLLEAALDNAGGRGCLLVNALHQLRAADAASAASARRAFAALAQALRDAIAQVVPAGQDAEGLCAATMAAIAGLRTLQRAAVALPLRRAAAERFADMLAPV